MAAIPVGVQLYSVRDECARDLPSTLARVAEMGYEGVEFAGYYGHSARDLRQMLDDLGLACCGAHIGLDTLMGNALQGAVEFHLELGNPYLIVPWIADERRNSQVAWLETALLFSNIADRLKTHGLRVGYHNHHVEFERFDGETGFDLFYSAAAAGVLMQLDTGNALHGGVDPLDYLERYPGRAVTVHLKEYSSSNPEALLGEGEIEWQKVFDACETVCATEWYIVEQESYPVSPLESIERCRAALKKMGR